VTDGGVREGVDGVLSELRTALNDATAAHAFASMGLERLPSFFEGLPRFPQNPDPDVFIGVGDPNTPEARTYASWRLSTALQQVAKDGPVERRLGHQWIVFVYSLWEHEYRPRLAAAHGCSIEGVRHPLLGDLRHLRNDVVHHRGIASKGETGRCELLAWFGVGDGIDLRGEHFEEFMRLFPWAALGASRT
jgi:hypothetical protein